MDPSSQHSLDNMVDLTALSEASLLHNLRIRYWDNVVYTSVGSILISVNPFCELQLYTSENLEKYKENGYRDMPPHVYGIADMTYTSMNANGNNQSCIVSGESGAGKTEVTKIFLQYIAEISSQAAIQDIASMETNSDKITLQEQILRANPLMEAFGNAKTVRNDNSSRFGKWIEIKFNNKRGTIIGGSIKEYLLEKSRIVKQSPNERNFHIFYNLCAGAGMDSSVRQKFQLTDARDYKYLNKTPEVMNIPGMNDEVAFEDVLKSMAFLGFSFEEQDNILMIVAAVLHLGNIDFVTKSGTKVDDSEIYDQNVLRIAAAQLGVDNQQLEDALTTKKLSLTKEVTRKAWNTSQATDTRDTLCKALYTNLFGWLIKRINQSFNLNKVESSNLKEDDISFIGVLDIFGFEVFDRNSLEQLCINYCNEKLQLHFNNHIFTLEAEFYKAEGIDVSKIDFVDNMLTIHLFEDKKVGIYAQMDEQMFSPYGTESKFLDEICKIHKGHSNFRGRGLKKNYERASFTIIHYAGPVMYNVVGFLEKNSDKLSEDLSDLIKLSSNQFISNLLVNTQEDSTENTKFRRNRRKKGASLCTKFKNQLNLLMTTLEGTEPHFIRCIKPNQDKLAGLFSSQLVLEQLRYAGILEVCRIRKLGYPIRKEFKNFLNRYICLVDKNTEKPVDAVELCQRLEEQGLMVSSEFKIGKLRIFFRAAQVDVLEGNRSVALKGYAILLQQYIRGWIERKRYQIYLEIVKELLEAVASRDVSRVNKAITAYGYLPFGGIHRRELQDARQLLQQMKENERVLALLVAASEDRTLGILETALAISTSLQIVQGFKEKDIQVAIDSCERAKEQIIFEEQTKQNLKIAIQGQDLKKIATLLGTLNELGLDSSREYEEGEIIRTILEERKRVFQNIDRAVLSGDLEDLNDALIAADEIGGFEQDERYVRGKSKQAEIISALAEEQQLLKIQEKERRAEELRIRQVEERKKAMLELQYALASRNLAQIHTARNKALKVGLQGPEVDRLLAQVHHLERVDKQIWALRAAMNGLKTLLINRNGIETNDTQHLIDIIDNSRQLGLTEDNAVLKEAVDLEHKASIQLEIQAELKKAMDTSNVSALQRAIFRADEQDLDLEIVFSAREMLKVFRISRPQDFNQDRVSIQYLQVSRDEFKATRIRNEETARRRQELITEARHPKYHYSKFYNIRSPSDYVRGVLFNKRRYMEHQLVHQSIMIPKSILVLRREDNKSALSVYKNILGYCGEISMQYPASLAQDILEKGIMIPQIVDEIYIQLCKHITDNDEPESLYRGWQLMCMVGGTFPPSAEFELYLINFLVEHFEVSGMVGTFAAFALRSLEGILVRGASSFVLKLDSILAYKQRPPVLSTIQTIDGTIITQEFPIPPDVNVGGVIDICTNFIELDDPRKDLFGLYVNETPEDETTEIRLPESGYSAMRRKNVISMEAPPPPPLEGQELYETSYPLRSTDFLGEVVTLATRKKRKFTLTLKKKLFLPNDNEESNSIVYRNLLFMQAADEIDSGNVLVESLDSILYLTAIRIQLDLELGKYLPVSEKQLLQLQVLRYFPFSWRHKKSEMEWVRQLLPKRGRVNKIARKDPDGQLLKKEYIKIVTKLPLWGFNFFHVRDVQSGKDVIMGIRYEGFILFTGSKKVIKSYEFSNIIRWGGTSLEFWCHIADDEEMVLKKISFYTRQAKYISNLFMDYTRLREANTQ